MIDDELEQRRRRLRISALTFRLAAGGAGAMVIVMTWSAFSGGNVPGSVSMAAFNLGLAWLCLHMAENASAKARHLTGRIAALQRLKGNPKKESE